MITPEQKAQVDYNDLAVKNFKRNIAIKLSIEEKEHKQRLARRTTARDNALKQYRNTPRTFTLSNMDIILESELTEDIIDSETARWFEQKII